jgi:hypothetical protein
LRAASLDREELEQVAGQKREYAGQIFDWMLSTALPFLNEAAEYSREAREMVLADIQEFEKDVRGILWEAKAPGETENPQEAVHPAYARAGWLALFQHYFKVTDDVTYNMDDLRDLLDFFIQEKYLARVSGPTPENPNIIRINALNACFVISPASHFGADETKKVQEVVDQMVAMALRQQRAEQRNEVENLRKKATPGYSLANLEEKVPGQMLMFVPATKIIYHEGGKPRDTWLPSGHILIKSDGEKIMLLDAVGGIERLLDDVKGTNVHILLHSLHFSLPPKLEQAQPDLRKKVKRLWRAAKSGVEFLKEEAKIAATLAEMEGKASLTPEEWFLDDTLPVGTCLAEYRGRWVNMTTDQVISNHVFLLVTRGPDNKISIAEVPDHLKEFFASCMGKEHEVKGPRFEGVGQPLQAVLKAIHGQVLKASQRAAEGDGGPGPNGNGTGKNGQVKADASPKPEPAPAK